MAVELVGKRCLCVSGGERLELAGISRWSWRAGVIRACDSPALTVKLTSRLLFRTACACFWAFPSWYNSYKCLFARLSEKSFAELLIWQRKLIVLKAGNARSVSVSCLVNRHSGGFYYESKAGRVTMIDTHTLFVCLWLYLSGTALRLISCCESVHCTAAVAPHHSHSTAASARDLVFTHSFDLYILIFTSNRFWGRTDTLCTPAKQIIWEYVYVIAR